MQDRPFVSLAVLGLGLVNCILSSLPAPGCSVLMKRAGRLGMGGARRDCKKAKTSPPQGRGIAPYCKEHVVILLARVAKA